MLTVPASYVTAATAARASLCGHPLTLHRESGQTDSTRFSCGSPWCSYCGRVHRLHVADCIADKATTGEAAMVTLTLPPIPDRIANKLGGRTSELALRAQIDVARAAWRRTAERMRWYRYHATRGDIPRANAMCPPPGRPDPHPEFASTWDRDRNRWKSAPTSYGYVWALEVTAGRAGRHWHVHRHVLVTDLAWAERLNAAWQASVQEMGLVRGGRWTRTDIMRDVSDRIAGYLAKPGTFDGDRHAAQSLSTYLAKGSELAKIPRHLHAAYVAAAGGLRRWDAGGTWRPLGVAREPQDDAVVAVEVAEAPGVLVPASEWWAGDSPIFELAVHANPPADPPEH